MKKEKKRNSLVKGAMILTFSTILVKFLGLAFKVPLSYILSDEGMGYFNTAYSIYVFFYVVCTAGVPKSISVLIADNENQIEQDKIFLSAFCGFSAVGIAATIVFMFFTPLFSHLIGSSSSALTMLAIAPSVSFVSASGALRGYFNGKLKLAPIAVSELISALSKLVLGVLFAQAAYRRGLETYKISAFAILGITIGSVFGFLYLYLVKKNEDKKDRSQKVSKMLIISNNKVHFTKILKLALPITLTAGIGSLLNLLDVTFVMRMLHESGFSELQANILYGNYTTLVVPMFNLISTILSPIGMVMLPLLTKSFSSRNYYEFQNKLDLMYRLTTLIAVPVSFVLMFFASPVLKIIFEDTSASMAAPLLSLLAPAVILMSLLFVLNTAAEGMGNFNIPLISLSVGSIVKILISVILLPTEKFNLAAAPIGTMASYLLGFIISYVYMKKSGKVNISYIKPVIISIFSASVSMFLTKKFSLLISSLKNLYLETFLSIFMFFITYLLIMILFYFKKQILCMQNRQKSANLIIDKDENFVR